MCQTRLNNAVQKLPMFSFLEFVVKTIHKGQKYQSINITFAQFLSFTACLVYSMFCFLITTRVVVIFCFDSSKARVLSR